MWNRLSQAAALVTGDSDELNLEEKSASFEDKEKLQHQEGLIQQLKDLVRDNESRLQDKTKEYDDLSSKFQKHKIQTKAKISSLSAQIKSQDKTSKKDDCDFDDASSTDSSDQSQRGKVLLLKRQLDQSKQQTAKKEEEVKKLHDIYERKINDLELQLSEKNVLISNLAEVDSNSKTKKEKLSQNESDVPEMYAQIVYKDSKILQLNDQILELEKKIIDLQEHIKEKDEVLQQRSRAVHLITEDLNRKGKTVVDELDDTREQMKIMQTNFSLAEDDWKAQLEKYELHVKELETCIFESDKKLKSSEAHVKSVEKANYELSVKNAELQKKIVCVQENASKQCELYNQEIEGKLESLKKCLEQEKQKSSNLQKSLEESASQSDNKVLKARVKERTKLKALERELNDLKKTTEEKPEVLELHQRLVELEEEKGSLQLKLMELEEQVAQIDKYKEKNDVLQNNINEEMLKVQHFKEQVNQLEYENKNCSEKFQILSSQYKEIDNNFLIVCREKTLLEQKVNALLQEKEHLEHDYKELKHQHLSLKKNWDDISGSSQLLKDQNVAYELKYIELEEMRENDEKEKKELQSKIKELEEIMNVDDKPDIQLEKENSDLKNQIKELCDSSNKLKYQVKTLLSQVENLQNVLEESKKSHDGELQSFKYRISSLETDSENTLKHLQDKIEECVQKEKSFQELQNNFSNMQNNVSDILATFDVKDLNEIKNYALKTIEECKQLKNDYEIISKSNKTMSENIKKTEDEIQRLFAENMSFKVSIEKQGNYFNELESTIENMKSSLFEKDNRICELSSNLNECISLKQSLSVSVDEKVQLLHKAEQQQKHLEQELENSKNALLIHQEKVKSNNSSLLSQIDELENEIDTLRNELQAKSSDCELFNNDLRKLQEQNLILQSKMEEKEKFSAIIIEKQETDSVNANKLVSEKELYIQDLKQQIEQLQMLLEENNSEKIEIELSLENLKADNLSLEQTFSLLKCDYEKLKNISSEQDIEITSLKEGTQRLSKVLKDKNSEIAQLCENKNEFINLIEDTKTSNTKLNEELEQLSLTLKNKTTESKSLFEQVEKLRTDVEDKRLEIVKISEIQEQTIKALDDMKETVRVLQEKNNVLEEEKHHNTLNMSEKDEAHRNLLHENVNFKNQITEIKRINNELETSVEQMSVSSDSLKGIIINMADALDHTDEEIHEFFSKLCITDNLLSTFARKYLHQLDIRYQNLAEQSSVFEKERAQLMSTIEVLQQSETCLRKSCDELLDQNNGITQELKRKADSNLNLQIQIQTLVDENRFLMEKIHDLQSENSLRCNSMNDELLNNQALLKDSINKVNDYEKEIMHLSAVCTDIEQFFSDCEGSKSNENDNKPLLERISGIRTRVSDLKIKSISIQRDLEQSLSDLMTKKNDLEFLYQNTLSDNKALQETICEMNETTNKFLNDKTTIEDSCSQVQNLLSQKEVKIADLESKLISENERLCELQFLFEKNTEETDLLKQVIDKNLKNAEILREKFLSLVSNFKTSLQIDVNTLCLQSDSCDGNDLSIELHRIIETIIHHYSSKMDYFSSTFERNQTRMELLEKGNGELSSQNQSLISCLTAIANDVPLLVRQNEMKFDCILTNLEKKENTLKRMKSRVLEIANGISSTKQLTETLVVEQNSSVSEIEYLKSQCLKSEEEIKILKIEKNKAEKDISAYHQDIAIQLDETEVKMNTFIKEIETKDNDLKLVNEKIGDLETLLRNRDQVICILNEERDFQERTIATHENEIERLNRQISDLIAELQNVNDQRDVLEVEIDRLRNELAICAEQKQSLQQHVDNTDFQLQSSITEKSDLEASMEQMQHQINSIIEKNLHLTKASEKMLFDFETKIESLNCELSNQKEHSLSEINRLINENRDLQSQNREAEKNLDVILKNCTTLKDALKDTFFAQSSEDSAIEFKNLNLDFIPCENINFNDIMSELISLVIKIPKNFLQNKTLIDEKTLLECRINSLLEEIARTKQHAQNDKLEETVTLPFQTQDFEVDIMQKRSNISSESADNVTDIESLKREINEYKVKFSKALSKLKIFKDKNAKLNDELKDLEKKHSQIEASIFEQAEAEKCLKKKIADLEREKETTSKNFNSTIEKYQIELDKTGTTCSEMRNRYSVLDERLCHVTQELEEYKTLWTETNVSYELQKEDISRVEARLRETLDRESSLKNTVSECSHQIAQLNNENIQFKQEVENSKKHAEMLLSDNDTYQALIEKLKSSKSILEQKLLEAKQKFAADLKDLEQKHETVLARLDLSQSILPSEMKVLHDRCSSLEQRCSELQQQNLTLQIEKDTHGRNQGLLEKEKLYLQHQLKEKDDELQKAYIKLDECLKNADTSLDSTHAIDQNRGTVFTGTNEGWEENKKLKLQLDSLMHELNLSKSNYNQLLQNQTAVEIDYQTKISRLEALSSNQLETAKLDIDSQNKTLQIRHLESELTQAMSSLHKQGVRCEELSLEVSKLLEERNVLKWQLQQYSPQSPGSPKALDNSEELLTIQVDSPQVPNIVDLQARLFESEKTCDQLRKANDALDRALSHERDQKRLIEEELDQAKEHISEDVASPSEYRILLEESGRPEMFVETNFSINRQVRTHAYKVHRWLNGRRNYFWRLVQSRNYPTLLYVFYIVFIHVWLLSCVFS